MYKYVPPFRCSLSESRLHSSGWSKGQVSICQEGSIKWLHPGGHKNSARWEKVFTAKNIEHISFESMQPVPPHWKPLPSFLFQWEAFWKEDQIHSSSGFKMIHHAMITWPKKGASSTLILILLVFYHVNFGQKIKLFVTLPSTICISGHKQVNLRR